MNNHSQGHDFSKIIIDPDFESGALFDVETPTDAGQQERHLNIVPVLGAIATEKHAYSDVRAAAANDDTCEGRRVGMPIIEQSPHRVVNGRTYISVPGSVPIIPARRKPQ